MKSKKKKKRLTLDEERHRAYNQGLVTGMRIGKEEAYAEMRRVLGIPDPMSWG